MKIDAGTAKRRGEADAGRAGEDASAVQSQARPVCRQHLISAGFRNQRQKMTHFWYKAVRRLCLLGVDFGVESHL
eukprot:2786335-Rhodomonas_salina.1